MSYLEILDKISDKVEEIRWRDYHKRKPFIMRSIQRRRREALKKRRGEYDYDWYDW